MPSAYRRARFGAVEADQAKANPSCSYLASITPAMKTPGAGRDQGQEQQSEAAAHGRLSGPGPEKSTSSSARITKARITTMPRIISGDIESAFPLQPGVDHTDGRNLPSFETLYPNHDSGLGPGPDRGPFVVIRGSLWPPVNRTSDRPRRC